MLGTFTCRLACSVRANVYGWVAVAVLPVVLFWMSYHCCITLTPIMTVLSWLYRPGYPDQIVLSRLPMVVLYCLYCPGCSCPGCPPMAELSSEPSHGIRSLAVMSLTTLCCLPEAFLIKAKWYVSLNLYKFCDA
jgi:hypothetical protein